MAPVSTNTDQVGPDSTLWKKSKFLFSSFLTLCFYLEWIAYFFLLLFQRKMNRKIRTNNVFCCVHCHSLIYFLCSCLQLLKIISLRHRDTILHDFMSVSFSSNFIFSSVQFSHSVVSGSLRITHIQFMALLPLLYF